MHLAGYCKVQPNLYHIGNLHSLFFDERISDNTRGSRSIDYI